MYDRLAAAYFRGRIDFEEGRNTCPYKWENAITALQLKEFANAWHQGWLNAKNSSPFVLNGAL